MSDDWPTLSLEPGAKAPTCEPRFEVGDALGRFIVADEVGSGGMGVVLRAFDPELDREVALKLVRQRRGGSSLVAAADARLAREAQAMARLNHPNVLPVFGVERTERGVCIAMEFVDGETLRDWLSDREPGWTEVLDIFIAAGRGLQAAHSAGLVHRDFKPTNVMVANDGRVLVMDFGLARAATTWPSDDGPHEAASSGRFVGASSGDLTSDGVVVGTPRYMAPEQHMHGRAEESADQYAFCTALFEAIYGSGPFGELRHRGLLEAKANGVIRFPVEPRIPVRIRDAIARGLDPNPEQRWPAMADLLRVLETRPSRYRPVAFAGGAAVLAAAATTWALQGEPACADGAQRLEGIWDDAAREAVGDAMHDAGKAYAESTWVRVVAGLDLYANEWAAAHKKACGQRGADLDRTMACLQQRRWALGHLAQALAETNATTLGHALGAMRSLPSIADCDDPSLTALPSDPGQSARVTEVRRRLLEVRLALDIADNEGANTLASALLKTSREIGFEPLIAEASLAAGAAQESQGDYTGALTRFEEAYTLAVRSGHEERAAEAATKLLFVNAHRLKKLDEAARWQREAAARVARLREPGRSAVDLAQYTAQLRQAEGDLPGAIASAREALALQATIGGSAAPLHDALGNALGRLGEHAEAEAEIRRGYEIRVEEFGDAHPTTASSLNNLGILFYRAARWSDAADAFERTLQIWRDADRLSHPQTASSYNNLGAVYVRLRRNDDAAEAYQRALEIWEAALGPNDPALAHALNNLGNVRQAQERYAEAMAHHERGLQILREAFGTEHVRTAASLNNLASLYQVMGRYDEALANYDHAAKIWEAALGPDHQRLANAINGRGEVLRELGRADEALEEFERALEIRTRAADPLMRAASRFNVAKAMVAAGKDKEQARAEARLAREEAGTDQFAQDIDNWLLGQ